MRQRKQAEQEAQESCSLLQEQKSQLQEQVATLQTTAHRLQEEKSDLERTLVRLGKDRSSLKRTLEKVLVMLLQSGPNIKTFKRSWLYHHGSFVQTNINVMPMSFNAITLALLVWLRACLFDSM